MAGDQEKTRRDAALERAASQKAAREKLEAKAAKLRASVDEVLRTEAGRALFVHLFHICGYNQADIPQDALKHVDSGELLYNTTRRSIYVKLRALASRALLTPVEEAAEISDEEVTKEN